MAAAQLTAETPDSKLRRAMTSASAHPIGVFDVHAIEATQNQLSRAQHLHQQGANVQFVRLLAHQAQRVAEPQLAGARVHPINLVRERAQQHIAENHQQGAAAVASSG